MSNQLEFIVKNLEEAHDLRGANLCTFRYGPRWTSVKVGQVLDYVAKTEDKQEIAAGKLVITDVRYGPLSEMQYHWDRDHLQNGIRIETYEDRRSDDSEPTVRTSIGRAWRDIKEVLFEVYGKERIRDSAPYTVLYFVVIED